MLVGTARIRCPIEGRRGCVPLSINYTKYYGPQTRLVSNRCHIICMAVTMYLKWKLPPYWNYVNVHVIECAHTWMGTGGTCSINCRSTVLYPGDNVVQCLICEIGKVSLITPFPAKSMGIIISSVGKMASSVCHVHLRLWSDALFNPQFIGQIIPQLIIIIFEHPQQWF